jgi:hypothetical protein
MQRRTIWIVAGVLSAALLLVCIGVGGAGYYMVRQQQRQFVETLATLSAGLEQATSSADFAPTSRSTTPTNPVGRPAVTSTPPAADTTPEAVSESPAPDAPPEADVAASLIEPSKAALSNYPDATRYRIRAMLDPQANMITGAQSVRLTNTEDTALNEIYFRLYVNAPHYKEGEITVEDVQIDDIAAQSSLEVNNTALKIALPQPLSPGQSIEISMLFTTIVPGSGGGYGIFNEADGVFALYNWHPELTVYEKGGWLLNPVSAQGDPTNTDAANYEVTFAAPQAYTVITSGSQVDRQQLGSDIAHSFVAALARNFVIVAGDQFESATQEVGAVKINSYFLPDSEQGGQVALKAAATALDLFNKEFGAYPYAELDVAQIELGGGAAGMEATGLIMIGSDYYDPASAAPLAGLDSVIEGTEGGNVLVFTTAHEVAHQWWYGVVGSDAYQQPWLDESLTNWSSAFYVDRVVGEDGGELARDLFMGLPYRSILEAGDQRLDQSVAGFNDQAYGAIVYGKGALMYDVLRQELGDAKFFEFLRRYYQEQQFDRADSGEWLQTLSQVAGKDMTPFYQKWVESETIQDNDLPPGGSLTELFRGRFNEAPRRSRPGESP